jgi:hypothetical protein
MEILLTVVYNLKTTGPDDTQLTAVKKMLWSQII